jgi:hypothetical protein
MKKILAVLFSAMVVLNLSVTAFAEDAVSVTIGEADGATIDGLLIPGTEYLFPLSITIGSSTSSLTSDDLKTYKFSIDGQYHTDAIESAKLVEDGEKSTFPSPRSPLLSRPLPPSATSFP